MSCTFARMCAVIIGFALIAAPLTMIQTAQADPDSGWTPRGEDYAEVVRETDIPVTMSDGVTLYADVVRPADDAGDAVDERFPVVVTITPYNKSALQSDFGGSLGGGDPDYLVKRGYVQVIVDVRGTGSSEGSWGMFSDREQQDSKEIVEWAASTERDWANGDAGMAGASYMGISQIFAAARKPEGLKAIFPQVPLADVYRDVVASGGQLDVGFIPLFLGLVTTTGLVPPAFTVSDPESALQTLTGHLFGAGTFTAPLLLDAALGGNAAFDGPFYAERSPINVIDEVDVPTFITGGEYDLFQRGTPLLFEKLEQRGQDVKFIFGPWSHIQASSGEGLEDAGYGPLNELQLRWFDHHVKGLDDSALDNDIPRMTHFEQGSGDWRTSQEWVGDDLEAQSWRTSGSSAPGAAAALTTGEVENGSSPIAPVPVTGLCTRSSSQWTAGASDSVFGDQPCNTDNRFNDELGVIFDSAPMESDVHVKGPINARLYTESLSGDGMLSVHVSSVSPDGVVSRLTGGWQVLSLRELDEGRTRTMDGEIIQPYHPFTEESKDLLESGEVAPIDVEVFPTGARIPEGHNLRMSVQAFDVPHLAPTLPDAPGNVANVMTIHNSDEYPSRITLPTYVSDAPVESPETEGYDGEGDDGDEGSDAAGTGEADPGTSGDDSASNADGSTRASTDDNGSAGDAAQPFTESAADLPNAGGPPLVLLAVGLLLARIGTLALGSHRILRRTRGTS